MTLVSLHITPADRCPHCDGRLDVHDGLARGHTPQAGNAMVCYHCRQLAMFVSETTLRTLTRSEQEQMSREPNVRRALAAIAESYTALEAVTLMRHQVGGV